MDIAVGVTGVLLIFGVLWDAFEVIILPRRVNRSIRLTRIFYRVTWFVWARLASLAGRRREILLSIYGPLSLLVLLSLWALGLVVGFACLHYSSGPALAMAGHTERPSFAMIIYFSATTFFTLGLGDISPSTSLARLITGAEAGMGFGFLGMVLSYLPVMYGAFSNRETSISLLDARAGSPPSACELLRRHADGRKPVQADHAEEFRQFLLEWEQWSAELLESHLSYPVLGYYRSQHSNQSWLSALTTILDVCALCLSGTQGVPQRQARMTFAIARHAVIDLCQIFDTPPLPGTQSDRVSDEALGRIRGSLKDSGFVIRNKNWSKDLRELRLLYEPYVAALSTHFRLALPLWIRDNHGHDNWQSSPWKDIMGSKIARIPSGDHF